jgi:hypothetical protein
MYEVYRMEEGRKSKKMSKRLFACPLPLRQENEQAFDYSSVQSEQTRNQTTSCSFVSLLPILQANV